MELQYKEAMANRQQMLAQELLAIKGASEAKLQQVIAANNSANGQMKKQIEAINAQLWQGAEEGGDQYNYTVNVLQQLQALLVQSVQHHETHVTNLQANTVMTEEAHARFNEIQAKIEEVIATQKSVESPTTDINWGNRGGGCWTNRRR